MGAFSPHNGPRRDCLGRERSVGGGANEKRELEISNSRFSFAPPPTLPSRPRQSRLGRSCGENAPIALVRSHDRAASPSKGNCLCPSKIEPISAANPKNLPVEFTFDESLVRTVVKDSEMWFVAKDVCEILGIAKTPTQFRARLQTKECPNVVCEKRICKRVRPSPRKWERPRAQSATGNGPRHSRFGTQRLIALEFRYM